MSYRTMPHDMCHYNNDIGSYHVMQCNIHRPEKTLKTRTNLIYLSQLPAAGRKAQPPLATPLLPASATATTATATPTACPDGPRPAGGVEDVATQSRVSAARPSGGWREGPGGGTAAGSGWRLAAAGGGGWFEFLKKDP